jgi:hypothetical protein
MDPYDVALTKLKRDSDKDVQDVLALEEKRRRSHSIWISSERDMLRNFATTQPGGLRTTILSLSGGSKPSLKTAPLVATNSFS